MAALRASEIRADVILKATKVDGIYDRDPNKFPDARRYDRITFTEALTKRLQIMSAPKRPAARIRIVSISRHVNVCWGRT